MSPAIPAGGARNNYMKDVCTLFKTEMYTFEKTLWRRSSGDLFSQQCLHQQLCDSFITFIQRPEFKHFNIVLASATQNSHIPQPHPDLLRVWVHIFMTTRIQSWHAHTHKQRVSCWTATESQISLFCLKQHFSLPSGPSLHCYRASVDICIRGKLQTASVSSAVGHTDALYKYCAILRCNV